MIRTNSQPRRQSYSQTDTSFVVLRYVAGAFVALLLVVSATIVALARYLARRITMPRRSRRPAHYTFTPWEFSIDYRAVRIPINSDELDAWYLPQDTTEDPVILCLSGHGGNKSELLGVASALHRDGFACLLIDFRGTGQSTGSMMTLGHNETEDARAALDWIERQAPGAPVGAIGYSLGGSVALTLAATDTRIRAVVSDSAFATQYSVLAHQVRRVTGLWPTPVLKAAAPMLRRRHRRGYDDFAPANIIHRISPRPVLLIHPEDDALVPYSEGMLLWENAREPKELWTVEGVGHCGAYFEDREGYCRRVSQFLRESLESDREQASA